MTVAQDFTLADQDGNTHSLSQYRGKWVVLYFYPRDDTPGCTTEACNFRSIMGKLAKMGVAVLGVSKDSVASHKKFAEKYKLNFSILSDEDKAVLKLYGAWGKKKFLGREFDGTIRKTYIIDPKGTIVKVYEHVKAAVHVAEVERDLKTLVS